MNDRMRLICAVVLVLVGLVCIAYAMVSWYQMGTAGAQPAARPPAGRDNGVEPEAAPEGRRHDDKPDAVAAPVAPRQGRQPTGATDAHRKAASLWVLLALPLVFVVMVLIIVMHRWFRPRRRLRTAPSDDTDLWEEAGKRLRLE